MENVTRHFLKAKGLVIPTSYLDSEHNTFQKVSHPQSAFIKIPVNIAASLKDKSTSKAWKDFKLYVKYLDMKVQNPDCGTFRIFHSHRYYQRVIKKLVAKGWVTRSGRNIYLRAYQHVWRDMGIDRVNQNGILKFKYWKIPLDNFSDERKVYLKEIEHEIRKRITKRKLAQFRYALKEKDVHHATFSAKSASSLFGYSSPATGSKLRAKYFEVKPMTPEESKPRFNKKHGRFEEPTKLIAI